MPVDADHVETFVTAHVDVVLQTRRVSGHHRERRPRDQVVRELFDRVGRATGEHVAAGGKALENDSTVSLPEK
jgi:hypothetical protein